MNKSLKELAQDALRVQDACNLSGVVSGFSRAMSALWEHSDAVPGRGTDWVNTHPIAKVWADKVAHLTNTQTGSVMSAFNEVSDLAGE